MFTYSIEQAELLGHTHQKVADLFAKFPAPAHGLDHAERVAAWAREIAAGENARHPFLCELTALLHDIGRSTETRYPSNKKGHHELSYELLRQWFAKDPAYDLLTDDEKRELLYAVRYHWNNAADAYDTAWILRDADKLDGMGSIGLKRSREMHSEPAAFQRDIRFVYDMYYWIRTDTAKRIVREKKLMEEVDTFYRAFLEERIEPIEL